MASLNYDYSQIFTPDAPDHGIIIAIAIQARQDAATASNSDLACVVRDDLLARYLGGI